MEQPHRRIPRAVVTGFVPSPAGIKAVQKPNRFIHGACQMRDGGIDADHKVQIVDKGGGVLKVETQTHMVNDGKIFREFKPFFLKAVELNVFKIGQVGKAVRF